MIRVRHLYKVDGGRVPSHHHPHNVEIVHNVDRKIFEVWEGSMGFRAGSLKECEDYLKDNYDRITLTGIVTSKSVKLDMVIKWEQTNYAKSS